MLTHIVLFRFQTESDAKTVLTALLNMRDKIPSLRSLEAGIDISRGPRNFELGLITRFDDLNGLNAYRTHPIHLKVLELLRPITTEIAAVDFEQ